MKALIIEDDPTIQRALARLLRRRFDRCDVWVADSADLAIDYLKTGICSDDPFGLVLSDFNLIGGQTGGDVLEWIREHASYLEPRFLFLSDDLRAKAMHPHFLQKPASPDEIRGAIDMVLRTQP